MTLKKSLSLVSSQKFAYPIEGTGMTMLLLAPYIFIDVPWQFIMTGSL